MQPSQYGSRCAIVSSCWVHGLNLITLYSPTFSLSAANKQNVKESRSSSSPSRLLVVVDKSAFSVILKKSKQSGNYLNASGSLTYHQTVFHRKYERLLYTITSLRWSTQVEHYKVQVVSRFFVCMWWNARTGCQLLLSSHTWLPVFLRSTWRAQVCKANSVTFRAWSLIIFVVGGDLSSMLS